MTLAEELAAHYIPTRFMQRPIRGGMMGSVEIRAVPKEEDVTYKRCVAAINEAIERCAQACDDHGCPDCARDVRQLKGQP